MFWLILYSIALAQGVFLTVALLLRPTANWRAARYLALLVTVFTLIILVALIRDTASPSQVVLAKSIGINGELLVAPLILLFIRALLSPDARQMPRALLHFIPLGIGLIFWLVFNFAQYLEWTSLSVRATRWAIAGFVAIKSVFIGTYLIYSYRTLLAGLEKISGFSFARKIFSMRWLGSWLLLMGVAALFIYVVFWMEFFGLDVPVDSDRIGIIVQTTVIFLISWMVMIRPWVLAAQPKNLTQAHLSDEVDYLQRHLRSCRPYLNPDLSMSELAASIDMTENRLSYLINTGLNTNYYQLVTQYRLAHFESLAGDPGNRRRSVTDLAFESGFNSKASFYRLFREAHNMTPGDYIKSVQVA